MDFLLSKAKFRKELINSLITMLKVVKQNLYKYDKDCSNHELQSKNKDMTYKNILEPYITILESFNTKIDLKWYSKDKNLVADARIDNVDYQLKIEPLQYRIDDSVFDVLNLSFGVIDENGLLSDELAKTSINASKVVGVIYNGLSDKIEQYDFDAVMMHMKSDVDKRKPVYTFLANRWQKKSGWGIFSNIVLKKIPGEIIVLISHKMDTLEVSKLKKFIENASHIES